MARVSGLVCGMVFGAVGVIGGIVLSACSAQNTQQISQEVQHLELPPQTRQIAFTFDDGPRGDGPMFTGAERTEKLIAALADGDVDEAWFFITTNNIGRKNNNGDARVKAYAQAGHKLANHSHSHQWYSRTDTAAYIADMDMAEKTLANYDNRKPYYRYPYLDEGRSIEKRDAMIAALSERGMHNGYVTVDTYDWSMVSLLGEALKSGHDVDMDALRDEYVRSLTHSIEFYDEMAQRNLGRSPKHVLLLHENDMAAMFIDDLARSLRADGWEIISPTEAFTDDIASYVPKSLYLGQGRVAAIAFDNGEKPVNLVHEREDEDFLRAEFLALGLIAK